MILKELLKTRITSKARNERGVLLELIVTELNKEREKKSEYFDKKKNKFVTLKKMTGKQIAVKLSHVKTEDLMDFHQKCSRYGKEKGSYSKCMFGSLKVKGG